MVMHQIFREQMIRDRKREVEERAAVAARKPRARKTETVSFVHALIPALTHGLMRIPAPSRTAEGGC